MTAPLEGRDLAFRIGPKALVADVTVRLEPGRLAVVVGPNGAGKSTLVRLLCGELRPSAGEVLYSGSPVERIPGWRLACMRAVLPQASRLAFPFTVGEVVRIGLDGIGRGLTAAARAEMVAAALSRADVASLAGRAYQSLSGGEQQRVQFARVLAQLSAGRTVAEAQVLLLDEPTASLDLTHQLALLDQAAALARGGMAVLAVLHDLNLASAYADDLLVMAGGRLVAAGAPAAILDDALLRRVFGVDLSVGAVPPGGRPFVLPHGPARAAA
ncbi:heme ABC transporter ATP-binding protein [Enterovirga aerilata]|uniref:Heme ABC transporter ATP-binding protein n=1 Tax=Enterovirga aerilata TaxID=2730920 RepID=A0A849IA46_9HYPH|nr:heme ABC transporter ATP-binding protein [Enterovirga sp. DB1703]NNM72877.1 heme ABC transporter ATP-binding protein [Enterovirga sp. DB1703]